MRCPECGESSNARLKYCENCGGKMPESPQGLTGSRPALRTNSTRRALEGPSYAADILDEAEAHSQGAAYVPAGTRDTAEDTDPGQSRPGYDGPKWLASVPAHSQSIVGLAVLSFALALSILPSFDGVGVVGALLAVVGAVLTLARELRLAGEAQGVTKLLPEVLYRPEIPAAFSALLAALSFRMLGIGVMPVLWLLASGLIIHDQWRKVISGPDGVLARWFDPRQLLVMPSVLTLGGVGLALLTLFAPWATLSTLPEVPDAPVPSGPPELRVIGAQRAADDVLYSANAGTITLTGWDLSGAVLVELLLLSVLALLALKPEVSRPTWTRFAPVGVLGVGLLWALLHLKLSPGPFIFVVGLAAMGVQVVRQLRESRDSLAPAPAYDDSHDVTEREEDPEPEDMYPDDEGNPDDMGPDDEGNPDDMGPDEEEEPKPRGR
ncbi:hypothetical protein MFUL124B02_25460 [Myxococcus fulvus 124B02]|nr:hypothetical protein MFUL124B02_25460 [Myxococcus fulvus 124B02]